MRILIPIITLLLISCKKEISSCHWTTIAPTHKEIIQIIAKSDSNLVYINQNFLIEKTEVSNKDYYDFLLSIDEIYGKDSLIKLLPIFNEIDNQFIYDSILEVKISKYLFSDSTKGFPVVSVSHKNAVSYCKWKTISERYKMLIREGILKFNTNYENEDCSWNAGENYNSFKEFYLLNKANILNSEDKDSNEFRKVRIHHGIELLSYQLPSKKQWLQAFYGELDTTIFPLGKLKPFHFWQKIDSSKIISKNGKFNMPTCIYQYSVKA
jgi:hypothetical protein